MTDQESRAPLVIAVTPSSFAEEDATPLHVLKEAGVAIIANLHGRRLNEEETMAMLQDADGLIAGLEPLTRRVLVSAPHLKAIARVGIGMDNVDLAAARELGIRVSNTPDAPTDAVAEMTVGALLTMSRRIVTSNAALHSGDWKKAIGDGLKGRQVLLIGFGRIGRRVAELLRGFGAVISACDPALTDPVAREVGVRRVSLDEGLADADVISLHSGGALPLLNAPEFARMRPGVVILNSARGALIDEAALIAALEKGIVSQAWMDVFAEEPYKGLLTRYPQVVLTPHAGTYTRQCRREMETAAVRNLLDDLAHADGRRKDAENKGAIRDPEPTDRRSTGSEVSLPIELGALALQAVEKAFAPSLAMLATVKTFCIYGVGEVGIMLFHLCRSRGICPAAFLDDHATKTECCGVPVHPVKNGILRFQPDAVLLATIRATERMVRNLETLPYAGRILGVWDSNAQERSPHYRYTFTPPSVIRTFHNRHHGQRAFIMGNGPSLLKTDPRRLRNEITFAANNIFLLEDFAPTYYAAIDRVLIQERAKEINALPWVKFFPHLVSEWMTNGHFLKGVQAEWPTKFSTDISEFVEIDFTVTYSMMQIAFYMGCNPVYLIGVDHSYAVDSSQCYKEGRVLTSVADDPNHFHPNYFGKGRRWTSPPPMEKLDACYRKASEIYSQHGRELFNATAGGKLDLLPRVSFESLLSGVQVAGVQ